MGGPALDRNLRFADSVRARFCRRVGAVARWFLCASGRVDWRGMAWIPGDVSCRPHCPLDPEQHSSQHDSHAVCHGRRWISVSHSGANSSEVWDAVDCYPALCSHVLPRSLAQPVAVDFGLYLASHRDFRPYGSLCVAIASQASRPAANISHSVGKERAGVRSDCAAGDERSRDDCQ